ncbi:MAG TPA: diaminopimelate epimerase, partial [Dissulfuribacter thermophilus]|nr:diaminopimelate epimerase [Dissulfuribacter thermophilus]
MADPIRFKKMHGSGNDFILVDNRKMAIPLERGPEVAQMLCRPKFGIG